MKAQWAGLFFIAATATAFLLSVPREGHAVTRVTGNLFFEDAYARREEGSTNLFQGGVNLDFLPPTKKKLQARISLRLNYTRSDEESLLHFSPLGNLGIDLTGESFSLAVQESRYATVSSAAQLTETAVSRASLSLYPKELPRINTSISRTETSSGGTLTTTDTASFFGDYRYKWLNFRGGYTTDRRETTGGSVLDSSSTFLGLGGSYEIFPRTILTGDVDYSRFVSDSALGGSTSSTGTSVRLSANTRLLRWLGLVGNLSRTETDFESPTALFPKTIQQFTDVTANVDPYSFLRLSATAGNRRFNDAQTFRSVDFTILAASFNRRVREGFLLGLTGSRSYESDPEQGKNISDNFGLNTTMDLTRRTSVRATLGVNRSEARSFVSTRGFDASGTLADRTLFDDRPAGFTFFDTVNNNLYTKNSAAIGDWALTAHIEPVTERYSVNKSFQLSTIPTDKTTLAVVYTSSASSEELDLGKFGSQNVGLSLTYTANRRTNYGLSGTASFPETGSSSLSATATMAYRFLRGHQLGLNYGVRHALGKDEQSVSGVLRFALRKRVSLEFLYSANQLFREEQSDFVRVRFSKSF